MSIERKNSFLADYILSFGHYTIEFLLHHLDYKNIKFVYYFAKLMVKIV